MLKREGSTSLQQFAILICMHHLICDCDNTIGLPYRDVDDALAILYLLGREDVELVGRENRVGKQNSSEKEPSFHVHSGVFRFRLHLIQTD